ncbi:MAG: glycosyltransferase [Clostridia bacterium]|nr:glycosyltransferase [Clostridia bacterium]
MNKMGYIISVLSEMTDIHSIVVSPCETSLHSYVKGSLHDLNGRVSLRTFDSFHSKNKIIRGLGHIWTKFQLLHFLMTHVKSDDTVVVYHSLALMSVVKKLKKEKKCHLIIEVEELYSDVNEDQVLREKELEYLQIADKYIVITELLNKQVNGQNKPRIISHGTYRAVPKYSKKFNDGKIHIVYAGTFNPVKGGAFSAIEAAEYLDDNYVLHILGNGTEADTEMVIKKIEQVSARTKCSVVFDGYKTGKEFDAFIQSCHIGLSTQQPDGKYNASSFPSKILMYMSNGISVVSIRIPVVETSNVKDYIFYYDTPTPKDIANAVMCVPVDHTCDSSDRLHELHETFARDLNAFLKCEKENV